MEKRITTRTPYAYALGSTLAFISSELAELDKEMTLDVKSMESINPKLVPGVEAKYNYCMDKMIGLYNKLNLAFDMALSDEEKRILDEEFKAIQQRGFIKR